MFVSGGVIKSAMHERGYKHRRTEDQFSIRGEYSRNLQFVYSKEYSLQTGLVVDLVYFSTDLLRERLVIGLYRENPKIENGIYVNVSQSIRLSEFGPEAVDRLLNKLIPPMKG